jgi:hypothetical protein
LAQADAEDMWDETAWNDAQSRWKAASSKWGKKLAEVDSETMRADKWDDADWKDTQTGGRKDR